MKYLERVGDNCVINRTLCSLQYVQCVTKKRIKLSNAVFLIASN